MRTLIIDVCPKALTTSERDYRLSELESLVSTYGGVTIIKKIQKRDDPDYHTYIGSGKLDEIALLADELNIELIVIGNHLKTAQMYHIEAYFEQKKQKITVWDRMDLILKIFAEHAVSPESKLQIELAAIKHLGPRIYGMGLELGRQGGGSRNSKGSGETNTEMMKRHLQERIISIKSQLKTYEKTRSLHRESRARKNLSTIGVVGYTNAGKSALTNTLTKKGVLSEDKLFATLTTSVGKLWIAHENGQGKEFLISDTIGFIRDLPHDLIDAFRSTLEDSLHSDLLFHVVDASDPHIMDKITVVESTLQHIQNTQEVWMIANKVDLLSIEEREQIKILLSKYNPIYISAYTGEGVDMLKSRIYQHFVGSQ